MGFDRKEQPEGRVGRPVFLSAGSLLGRSGPEPEPRWDCVRYLTLPSRGV